MIAVIVAGAGVSAGVAHIDFSVLIGSIADGMFVMSIGRCRAVLSSARRVAVCVDGMRKVRKVRKV